MEVWISWGDGCSLIIFHMQDSEESGLWGYVDLTSQDTGTLTEYGPVWMDQEKDSFNKQVKKVTAYCLLIWLLTLDCKALVLQRDVKKLLEGEWVLCNHCFVQRSSTLESALKTGEEHQLFQKSLELMVSPLTFCGVMSPEHFSLGRNLTLFTNTVSWGTPFSSRTITPSGVCLLLLLPQPQPRETLPEEGNPVRWCMNYKHSFLNRWHFTLWAERPLLPPGRPQGHCGEHHCTGKSGMPNSAAAEDSCCQRLIYMLPAFI